MVTAGIILAILAVGYVVVRLLDSGRKASEVIEKALRDRE